MRLGPRAQAGYVVSWVLLGLMRAVIVVLPFSAVRRLLGEGRTDPMPLPPGTRRQSERARDVGQNVRRAARHTPWRSDCYPQALTAHLQLRLLRVPHTVSFGLRRVDDRLTAHSWVAAAGLPVTGGDPVDYTVVGAFTWLPRSERTP
ncbi:lasso peptide biosynthesis B2 protein [Aeromicrobium sp. 9AM]|uniref:lasso peptide biosynthesis B2 protein n=1 Tax=Aeromicrobium sp. 9AM TaxID=2653126 RepID=UPI0012F1875C|nr:lasso peptide biosynthesis B2 protein [Aeromicrobium sp. 9AM]VXC54922.1 conserved hypothetical protein [Aeromicrobium sp. 9AM]